MVMVPMLDDFQGCARDQDVASIKVSFMVIKTNMKVGHNIGYIS